MTLLDRLDHAEARLAEAENRRTDAYRLALRAGKPHTDLTRSADVDVTAAAARCMVAAARCLVTTEQIG